MFLVIQCTWDDVPSESELAIHSLFHVANDEVVLMGHSDHVAVTLAGEPFPVHLLVLLVCYFSGHRRLLLATLYNWGHPSVQGATEIKHMWWVWRCWIILKDEPNTVFTEMECSQKHPRVLNISRLIKHCWCITRAEHANQHQRSNTQTTNLWSPRYFQPVLFLPGEVAVVTSFTV